jgi:CubicO group peptidase (beta-lactamase class C family)
MSTNFFFRCLTVLTVMAAQPHIVAAAETKKHMIERAHSAISLLQDRYDEDEPGAAYLISYRGEVLLAGGIGKANMEWGLNLDDSTSMRLGSMSKPITATAVLALVEKGLLDLDLPIAKYTDAIPAHMGNVTLRQMLSHRSGLPEHAFDEALIPYIWQPMSTEKVIELQAEKPLQFEPGSQYAYSNFNYVVVANVLEHVLSKSYIEFINSDVFDSLGMQNSYYDELNRVIPNRASFYHSDDKGLANAAAIDLSHVSAAGALLASVSDMSHWINNLVDGKVVSRDTLEQAWTPRELPDGSTTAYGLGFNVSKMVDERIVWHTGLTPGAQGAFSYATESDIFVIILSNVFYWPADSGELVDAMMHVMLSGQSPGT